MYAVVLVWLALGTAQQLPEIRLTVKQGRNRSVETFAQVINGFPTGDIITALCMLDSEGQNEVQEAVCGKGYDRKCELKAGLNCEETEREGIYVNRRLRSGTSQSITKEICDLPGFFSRNCLNYCETDCNSSLCLSPQSCARLLGLNETCPSVCTSGLAGNSVCDPECNLAVCGFDNGECNCPAYCTSTERVSQDCDLSCNTTACNFDDERCIEGSGGDDGDPSWVKWVIGSLSIVCFL